MRLGLDHNGQRFEMLIEELPQDSQGNPDITGFRKINHILLFKSWFKKFIIHLQADEFEEIRAIFEKLMDTYTKELPYKENLRKVYPVSGPGDPLLKQLIG